MELIKKNIHIDRMKCRAATQITLEDDINITDARPDAYQLILEQGEAELDEVRAVADHVHLRGKLHFKVLYLSDEDVRRPACMEGVLPFEDQVYLDGVTPSDNVCVKKELEDLSVGLINSRKLSVQALLGLELYVEEVCDTEAAVELYSEEPVEFQKKPIELTSLAIQKKDIFRVRQDLDLPAGLPNILNVLWQSCTLKAMDFRLAEGGLEIRGEVLLFVFYEGEGENRPVMWYQAQIPVNGMLDCQGMHEDMIPDISVSIGHCEVEIRPDADGEERKISLDMVLDLDMKLYEEEQTEILADVYGVTKEVDAVTGTGSCKRIRMRSLGKTRVEERMKVGAGLPRILQLCGSQGTVRIGQAEAKSEGIAVTGEVQISCLYTTGDEEMPFYSLKGSVPFRYLLEIPDMTENCTWHLESGLDQLNVTMSDGEEVDVKAAVWLKAIVFENREEEMIQEVKVADLDPEKLANLPGIVAYVVKAGDTLWNIGKKYYVPVDKLREMNDLVSDELKPGEKLLVVKGME